MADPQTIKVQFVLSDTILDSPEVANYNQLQQDANSQLNARNYQSIDSLKWEFIANEIGNLVNDAQLAGLSSEEVSLIYGQIMIIITAQYLPIVSDFLGDQIAEQAATENIAADISAFLADAQNGFNALASTTTTTEENENKLFSGVMSLTGAVPGADDTSVYDYSFTVNYIQFDSDTGQFSEETTTESSILAFLTDPDIWGDVAPLSVDGASLISTALSDIPTIFNTALAKLNGTNPDAADDDSWLDRNLDEIASKTLTWTEPYGATTGEFDDIGSENAPLVYTAPNSVQQDFNQSTQAVQTVATATQTTQNFQVQEIDQYYGIINSIQQSQQQQCASMVNKQVV